MSVRFRVVRLSDGVFYNSPEQTGDPRSQTMTWDDGDEAQRDATYLTKREGTKWQPRRIVEDTKWRKREEKRFYDGIYYPVPWDSQNWYRGSSPDLNHFAHISIEQDAMIAFTPDNEHGTADKQKRMKPGKYLTEYFSYQLSPDGIRDWVAEFTVRYDDISFKLATTAKEIGEIYMNGPTSCMQYTADNFLCNGVHPSAVYAGPDLAVAYLDNGERTLCDRCEATGVGTCQRLRDRCNGKATYTARSVVWPGKKLYGRIYGDIQRLRICMEAAGYKAGTLEGARLSRLPLGKIDIGDGKRKEAFVMPYLDGIQRAKDDGKHLIVDVAGVLCCSNTNGIASDSRPSCDHCAELCDIRRTVLDHQHRLTEAWCEPCIAKDCTGRDDRDTGYYIQKADSVYCDAGGRYIWHKVVFQQRFEACSITHVLIPRDGAIVMGNGKFADREWFKTMGKYCPSCNCGMARSHQGPCENKGCYSHVEARVKAEREAAIAKMTAARAAATQVSVEITPAEINWGDFEEPAPRRRRRIGAVSAARMLR